MIIDADDYLEHFGVKGMQWGVRKNATPGVSSRTDRDAAKDAKEFARAKLFYGEGAGNRRKLINATVEAKSKKDPNYAKAFDNHLSTQDLSTHASKARSERKKIDRKTKNKQRAGALARRFTGEMGTQAAFVGVAVAGSVFLRSDKGQRFMKQNLAKVADYNRGRKNAATIRDFFKNQ